jgi:hypothetical protein
MPHTNARPFATFMLLACACAAYMGLVLWASLGVGQQDGTAGYPVPIQILVLLVPAVACAAVQWRRSKRAAISGARLWFHVAGSAIGAPLLGMWIALALMFVVFGQSP